LHKGCHSYKNIFILNGVVLDEKAPAETIYFVLSWSTPDCGLNCNKPRALIAWDFKNPITQFGASRQEEPRSTFDDRPITLKSEYNSLEVCSLSVAHYICERTFVPLPALQSAINRKKRHALMSFVSRDHSGHCNARVLIVPRVLNKIWFDPLLQ
jgi:hypothetical protein